MQLHRPKDINSLNEDFFKNEFSGNAFPEEKHEEAVNEIFSADELIQGEIDSIVVEHESDIASGYVARQIERLSNTQFTNNDRIFHDFSQEDREEDELFEKLDEKKLFDSFPEIDFDPSVFTDDENEDDMTEREIKRESVRKAKEEARATIENEKERIKEQKKLERTIQKPFGKRRTAVTLMILFVVIDLLLMAICGVFGNMASNGNAIAINDDITVLYVDGKNIVSESHMGKLIAVGKYNIQGSQTVLFTDDAGVDTIGKVIAIGDGVYGIDVGQKVAMAEKESILGVVRFSTPAIAPVYSVVSVFSSALTLVLLIALLLTVILSALRINKFTKEIKELEKKYNIV